MGKKKRGLGRGLDALGLSNGLNELLSNPQNQTNAASDDFFSVPDEQLLSLKLAELHPSRFQPRQHIDQKGLQELADSIRTQGIIQPILARRLETGGYEIIAGERRWRAARIAECQNIPTVVRTLSDEACMAQALIENLQRQDLNPIEEAMALKRLMDEFDLSHDAIAAAVGRSRSAVSNQIRLLNLGPVARQYLAEKKIEMGHARALLGLEENKQAEIAEQIVAQGWSVRQTEAIIRLNKARTGNVPLKVAVSDSLQRLQHKLASHLQTKIQVQQQASGKGKVVIHFKDSDNLERIIEQFSALKD